MTLIELIAASIVLYLLVLVTNFVAGYTGLHHAVAAVVVVFAAVSACGLGSSIVKRMGKKDLFDHD